MLAVLAVLAMGWQNAALRRVAGVPVHTTFVTGILTHLAEESVNGWYAWRDLRRAGTPRRPDDGVAVAFRRARLHGGVWGSYLAGGVLGAFLALRWDLWSLTLPLAVLAALIGQDVAAGDVPSSIRFLFVRPAGLAADACPACAAATRDAAPR